MTARFAQAVTAIERRGILLVYPLANRPEPSSLWSELHPRIRMRWAWDAEADGRVAALWRLREELARSTEVVYAKWFRGRATFFSRSVFGAILAAFAREGDARAGLSPSAGVLLDLLEDNSPQSTKELRANADLLGRANEAVYARSLKELWSRLLVVGVGEVNDGAFPSLLISATRHRFEELLPPDHGAADPARAAEEERSLARALADAPLFAREVMKVRASIRAANASRTEGKRSPRGMPG